MTDHDITLIRSSVPPGYRAECDCGFVGLTWNISSRPAASKSMAASSGALHLYDAGVTTVIDNTQRFKEEKR